MFQCLAVLASKISKESGAYFLTNDLANFVTHSIPILLKFNLETINEENLNIEHLAYLYVQCFSLAEYLPERKRKRWIFTHMFSQFPNYRVDPHSQSLDNSTLGHLYQPVGHTSRPGYTVVGESYVQPNSHFSHTNSGKSSFDICPDWASERKKSVVVRY